MPPPADTGARRLEIPALIASLALCFGVAGLGSLWTYQGLDPWYDGLRKPAWTPPSWVFGPVWSLLYLAMAVATWLVWRRRDRASVALPLSLFGVQLALNLAWSGIFFALHRPGLAFAEILLLWLAILATLRAFGRVSRAAAGLLVPYLAWVTFAAALNGAIWRLNA